MASLVFAGTTNANGTPDTYIIVGGESYPVRVGDSLNVNGTPMPDGGCMMPETTLEGTLTRWPDSSEDKRGLHYRHSIVREI